MLNTYAENRAANEAQRQANFEYLKQNTRQTGFVDPRKLHENLNQLTGGARGTAAITTGAPTDDDIWAAINANTSQEKQWEAEQAKQEAENKRIQAATTAAYGSPEDYEFQAQLLGGMNPQAYYDYLATGNPKGVDMGAGITSDAYSRSINPYNVYFAEQQARDIQAGLPTSQQIQYGQVMRPGGIPMIQPGQTPPTTPPSMYIPYADAVTAQKQEWDMMYPQSHPKYQTYQSSYAAPDPSTWAPFKQSWGQTYARGGLAQLSRPGYATGEEVYGPLTPKKKKKKKKKKEEPVIDPNYIPSTLEEILNAIDIEPRASGSFTEGAYGPENEQRTWSDLIGGTATVDLPGGFTLKGDYDKRRIKDRLYSPDDKFLDERVRDDHDRWKLELLLRKKFGGPKNLNQGGLANILGV
jgi:hypothetical protein